MSAPYPTQRNLNSVSQQGTLKNHLNPVITAQVTEDDAKLLNQHHQAAKNKNTEQSKQQDLKTWIAWCNHHDVTPMQPGDGDVCLWLSHMAETGMPNRLKTDPESGKTTIIAGEALAQNTIDRRLSTIRQYLRSCGCSAADKPLVSEHLKGIRNVHSRRRQKRAQALVPDILSDIIASIPGQSHYRDFRDRVIFLLGFSGALRVSDLAYLQVDNLSEPDSKKGLILAFERRKSKHDLSRIEIYRASNPKLCPVKAIKTMVDRYPSAPDQPLLRGTSRHGKPTKRGLTAASIAKIIKERALAAGFAVCDGNIQGHSLRRGFIDTALMNGRDIPEVMKTSGHSDPRTLMIYLEELGEFKGESLL